MTAAFGEQAPAGTPGGASTPAMFGDQLSSSGIQTNSGTQTVIRTPTGTTAVAKVSQFRVLSVPQIVTGGFKIADNESPVPTDRIFVTYNYYNNVTTQGGPNFDVHRETIGFEKTFLDGNASIGMRLPFLEQDGLEGAEGSEVGDLSIIFKWAFLNDRDTGNVLSAGLVVTVPTGEDFPLVNGQSLHSTFLQPYVGGIYNLGDLYVHGFSSIAVSTNSDDVTFWSNDIGIGYWLVKHDDDSFCRGIVPTVEGHLFTPLNHRNANDDVFATDYFEVTAGVNFVFSRGTTLGIAVGTPVTGPRPYDVEAIVSFNLRF
jgi:hypothetical protein